MMAGVHNDTSKILNVKWLLYDLSFASKGEKAIIALAELKDYT